MTKKRGETFEPTGYEVDWNVFWDLPLAVGKDRNDTTKTTVGAVIEQLLPDRISNADAAKDLIVDEHFLGSITLTTPAAIVQFPIFTSETGFATQVLVTMLKLWSRGAGNPVFFFYDTDHVTDDIHDSFSFFVVANEEIVDERVTFHRTSGNGFVSEMFTTAFETGNRIWSAQWAIERAQLRWWYRKFYEDTHAGRLTTLRDDVDLYHFVPSWKLQGQIASELRRLRWLVTGCLGVLLLLLLEFL